jgi:hypothetical protein
MSEILQPGQHPDADQLNAFVEHNLPIHEQQETLAHLATCADCRAIVYLAQPTELVQPRPIATRKPWFSGWNLACPAVAALACLAIFTVHLHNIGTAKREAASIATADLQQTPLPVVATPPPAKAAPSQPTSTQVEMPQAIAALAPKTPGAEATSNAAYIDGFPKRKRLNSPLESPSIAAAPKSLPGIAFSGASGQQSVRGSVSGASFQSASPASAALMAGPLSASSSPQAGVSPSDTASPQLPSASAGAAAQNNSPSFAALHSLGQQYHAASQAAPSPSVLQSAALAGPSQTVAAADAASTEHESNRSSTIIAGAAIGSLELSRSAKLQRQPVLPSHLPVLSTISNAGEELAIDTVGTLFRSEDSGVTWQPVPALWTGHAVRVSLAPSPNQKMAAKDSSTVTAPAAKRAVGAHAEAVDFELTTDTRELWISTDGQTWKRQ